MISHTGHAGALYTCLEYSTENFFDPIHELVVRTKLDFEFKIRVLHYNHSYLYCSTNTNTNVFTCTII